MSKEFPIVSVVIPTYNRSADLKRALSSVLAQTFQDFEVIVVDNHSIDNTDEMIATLNDPRIQLRKIHNNGVIAASRNKGIQEAKGELIAFLDSDDWWAPEKLQRAVEVITSGSDFTYHDMWLVNEKNNLANIRKVGAKTIPKQVYKNLLNIGGVIPNSSVVVRAGLIKSIGGFSEDRELITVEDFDCWLRLSVITEKFSLIPETLGYYWNGSQNNSSNASIQVIANKKLYNTYIKNNTEVNKQPLPIWFLYNMGRSNYLAGNYTESRVFLQKLIFRKTGIFLKLKALWMLTIQFFKYR